MSPDHSGHSGRSSLRLVKAVSGQMEALILKSRLEAENIPVHLDYESAGTIYGFRMTGMGRVGVMVPAAFERAARHICGTAEEGDPPEEEAGGRVA